MRENIINSIELQFSEANHTNFLGKPIRNFRMWEQNEKIQSKEMDISEKCDLREKKRPANQTS